MKMLVGFAPAVSADLSVRAISERLAQALGKPVLIENRPGAGSIIAATAVANALRAPDVAERLAQLGLDGSGSTPEEHAAQIRSDLARWSRIAKAANLKID